MKNFLKIEKLSLTISGKIILDEIDLQINSISKVGIIGKSGSGKSLFAYSILNFESEYDARKTFKTFKVCDLDVDDAKQNLSYIPQEPLSSLNPLLTIEKHFKINEKLQVPNKLLNSKIIDLLNEVGFQQDAKLIMNLYPHELSGGMAQRILIALSIQNNPKLIIADEATSSLDILNENKILNLLDNIQKNRDIGIILITHDENIANNFCDILFEVNNQKILPIKQTITSREIDLYSNKSLTNYKEVVADIDSLSLTIDNKKILENICLKIKKKDSIGLVGLSGAGKSSLVKVIIKEYREFEGKIEVFGKDINNYNYHDYAKKVQHVYQDLLGSLNPKRRIRKNLDDIGDLIGLERDTLNFKVKDLCKRLSIEPSVLDSLPGQISGGQRQRVLIMQALLWSPQLLILDEPVSSLDPYIQDEIVQILVNLRDELDLTVLAISHDIGFISKICDSVHIISEGKIIESGPLKDIVKSPNHNDTKSLISNFNR